MNLGFMSYFDTCSGYGNSAVELCIAASKLGATVIPYAFKIDVELPKDFTDLFTQREPEKLDAMIVFALPNQLRLTEKMRKRIKIKIGYSMWEQTRFSKDLFISGKPYKPFTEIWVPCKMNVLPFKEYAPDKNIEVMNLGINTDLFKYRERDNSRPFRYCMNGALGYRKGVFEVIEAFRVLRKRHPDWNVELHLKTSAKGMIKQIEGWAPGIKIYNQMFWVSELVDFYYNMDCMVAPSRGEGFHQPPLEFASTGGIVITTTWGGMEEWFDKKWAFPVKHKLIEIGEKWPSSLPGSMWIDPVFKSLLKQMEYVYINRDRAFNKARLGSKIVKKFDWKNVVSKMLDRISDLLEAKNRRSKSRCKNNN